MSSIPLPNQITKQLHRAEDRPHISLSHASSLLCIRRVQPMPPASFAYTLNTQIHSRWRFHLALSGGALVGCYCKGWPPGAAYALMRIRARWHVPLSVLYCFPTRLYHVAGGCVPTTEPRGSSSSIEHTSIAGFIWLPRPPTARP